MTSVESPVKVELAVRQHLVDLTVRMAWYLDHQQWDLMPTLFTPEVSLDYTSLNGGEVTAVSRDVMIGKWRENRTPLDATQHLLSNHLVTFTGDESAHGTAMFQATHRKANDQGGPLWTLGGEYHYTFSAGGGTWLIGGLAMNILWADGNRNIRDLR
ncbi:nuclear transport factor 2 family protein [Rhodococcus sovatensis]|uniref:Nuclear transport factor 2 family protein n=1 Tax=Rhodococcus sovatensis TaxID=1805840 RepID=A0ABZ2PTF6_9NOCA